MHRCSDRLKVFLSKPTKKRRYIPIMLRALFLTIEIRGLVGSLKKMMFEIRQQFFFTHFDSCRMMKVMLAARVERDMRTRER